MDIVIKSFNRPYYLERCIHSIKKFVSGNFQIVVLDDGTPVNYLEKIRDIYPDVDIRTSPQYDEKISLIDDRDGRNNAKGLFKIPFEFWRAEIAKCSPYFLLLEDDIWITSKIDVNDFERQMAAYNISMLRVGWSGNENVIQGRKYNLSKSILSIAPEVKTRNVKVLQLIESNAFKLKAILSRLGIISESTVLPYYTLYAVAGAFFYRPYWQYVCADGGTNVRENLQLVRAVEYWNQHPDVQFGATAEELTKTSFISSATNMFEGIDFDVFHFNRRLNEAWLKGNLDPLYNFPNDYGVDYLSGFLETEDSLPGFSGNYRKWVDRFKWQYSKVGCVVDN